MDSTAELQMKQAIARKGTITHRLQSLALGGLLAATAAGVDEEEEAETIEQVNAQDVALQQSAAAQFALATATARQAQDQAEALLAAEEEDAAAQEAEAAKKKLFAKEKKKIDTVMQRGLLTATTATGVTVVGALITGIPLLFWKTMELVRTWFDKSDDIKPFGLQMFSKLEWWEIGVVVVLLLGSIIALVSFGTLALVIVWSATHKSEAVCLLPKDVIPFWVSLYQSVKCP